MSDFDVPKVSHGLQYITRLPQDEDANEVAGFVVAGRAGDEDLLFWTCAYSIHGGGVNQWIVPEARTNATIFFSIPSDRKELINNNFVRRGLQIPEYLGADDLHFKETSDEARWEIAGRSYVWHDGGWELGGEHAGVACALTCRPAAPGLWTFGPFEDLASNTFAGYDVGILATGMIEAEGRKYEIRDAVGSHERACVGQGRDIMAELADGEVFVGDCFSDDLHLFFARHPGRPMSFGRIDVAGASWMVPSAEGAGVVHVTPVAHWHDPRSGLLVPSAWHVAMALPDASADLEIRYQGRGYWYYTTRSGVMVLMWLLGRASGTVFLAEGGSRVIQDALVVSRWGKTVLVAEETLHGREFPVLRESS